MATQTIVYRQRTTLRAQVFKLALPAVGEQSLNMLVGLVDVYLMGHLATRAVAQLGYGPAEGLSGVGLASYVLWFVTTLYMAGAVGSTAVIARETGANNYAGANNVVRQSVLLGLGMGLLGFVGMYTLAPVAMWFFSPPPTVAALAVSFLHITAFSMPLAGVMFLCNAALRGAGDTKTPLLIMLIVNGVNMLISWLLVSGQFGLPALGVEGAAWGAATARSVGGIIAVGLLLRGCGVLRIDQIPLPDREILQRIVRIGLPAGGEMLAFQGALMIFARFVTQLGTVAYAAYNTVITTHSISFLPGIGFAIAATTLVGQNLGAQDLHRARRSGHEALMQAAIFMSLMGLLFMLFPAWFLSLLVRDPDVVAAGTLPLRIVGAIEPLVAANFVYAGALRGAGDTRWPLLIKVISPWFVRLPLTLWLIPIYGLAGAVIAMSTDQVVQGILAWWRFRGDRWERVRV